MKQYLKMSVLVTLTILSLSGFTQIGTFPFDVTISGKGDQTILFIPGLGSSSDVWNETIGSYEDNFNCHSLTMAGFAGVPAQEGASFENWKNAIANYIVQNELKQPIVIGHSIGGGLGMALAADYPHLVSKLILVDALPCLPALMNPNFKVNENNDCSGVVNQMVATPDKQFYAMQKQMIPQLLAGKSKLEQVVGWTVASDRKTFAEMYCDFSNIDLREKISTISCPTLVLLNAGFARMTTQIEEQFKNLKTADLRYATKGRHFIMYDDKEWYDNQLAGFLSKTIN